MFVVRLLVSAMLFGFIAVPFMASADPFDDGVSSFERGDYATALQIWRPLAAHDPRAATNLGVMYAAGLGVQKDAVHMQRRGLARNKCNCWHQLLDEFSPDEAEVHTVSMACHTTVVSHR